MITTIHRADTRGSAHYGWLKSHHTFSFGSYHDPERMGFGLLRVLNDDFVAPGAGFDTHSHRNMEIVSIPLKGAVRHKDSEGHEAVIREGEVQLMSAGSGISHSEYNHSSTEAACFLQIWVMPNKKGIDPRYEQQRFEIEDRQGRFQTIVSPLGAGGDGLKINQQAYFSLIDLDKGARAEYALHQQGHGVYVFVVDGEATVAGEQLSPRDAVGVEDTPAVDLIAGTRASILIIEVPMTRS